MGHRALVAYERTDGQYTLHYSHWGAANLKLKRRISAESPFGGDGTDSKWATQLLAELADGLEAEAVDGYLAGEDRPSTVVEPKPRATGLTLDEIVADHLDYLHLGGPFVGELKVKRCSADPGKIICQVRENETTVYDSRGLQVRRIRTSVATGMGRRRRQFDC